MTDCSFVPFSPSPIASADSPHPGLPPPAGGEGEYGTDGFTRRSTRFPLEPTDLPVEASRVHLSDKFFVKLNFAFRDKKDVVFFLFLYRCRRIKFSVMFENIPLVTNS
jgi:hypothetical protein